MYIQLECTFFILNLFKVLSLIFGYLNVIYYIWYIKITTLKSLLL